MEIAMEDFTQAMNSVQPSTHRGTAVEFARVSWDDIGGLDEVKKVKLNTILKKYTHNAFIRS